MRKRTNIIKTAAITQIALIAALQCIISPFAIVFPFSPVPISFATLMLYLSVYILGKKKSIISCGIYLLIGLVGLPVFSGFAGGIGRVIGPTGGYMLGYLFLVFISGWFIEKWNQNSMNNYIMHGVGMVIGTAVCYLLGSFWLSYQADMSIMAAITAGVIPFISGDVVKIIIGIFVGVNIRKKLTKAGML